MCVSVRKSWPVAKMTAKATGEARETGTPIVLDESLKKKKKNSHQCALKLLAE